MSPRDAAARLVESVLRAARRVDGAARGRRAQRAGRRLGVNRLRHRSVDRTRHRLDPALGDGRRVVVTVVLAPLLLRPNPVRLIERRLDRLAQELHDVLISVAGAPGQGDEAGGLVETARALRRDDEQAHAAALQQVEAALATDMPDDRSPVAVVSRHPLIRLHSALVRTTT